MSYPVDAEISVIPVHIASSDVKQGCGCKRKRKSASFHTFILTANNPTQQILPPSTRRAEAWITAPDGATAVTLFVSSTEAGAQQQSADSCPVPINQSVPFPLNTTDAVWASVATGSLPCTFGVAAYYEQEE